MSQPKPFTLVSKFKPTGDQPKAISQLTQGLSQGLAYQTLLGVTGSGKTFTIANTIAKTQRPALILAPNKTLAAQLYGEMKEFFPHNCVEYFVSYYDYYQPEAYVPSSDLFIEKDANINEHIEQMRLSATKAILERKDTIIVATVSAIYGLGDPKHYLSMVLHLAQGHQIERQALLQQLVALQYQRNDMDFKRGTFRVRGEVVDVFPAESKDFAIRVHLFDQDIERIEQFDPLTGEVLATLKRTTVYPKTHYVTPAHRIKDMMQQVKVDLELRLDELHKMGKPLEKARLAQRTAYDLEMLEELGYCTGIENYSRYLSGRKAGEPPPTLLDYLPEEALVIIDESHVTISQIAAMSKGDYSRKRNLIDYGFRLPSALDNRPLRFEEYEAINRQRIFISATPGDYELSKQDQLVELVVRPTGLLDPPIEIRPVKDQIDDLISEIKACIKMGSRVLVTTLTKRMSENLADYLEDFQIKVRYLHSQVDTVERMTILNELRSGQLDVVVGINLLREGLDLPEVALVAILDADKAGFLRSTRSLIQTAGRAARNLHGRVIMYADQITDAMQAAMDETSRRRKVQQAYNEAHGITPKGIQRAIRNTLDANASEGKGVVEEGPLLSPAELAKEIAALEKEMYRLADKYEYEAAAKVRDQMHRYEAMLLELKST